jgi:hypothetical protein
MRVDGRWKNKKSCFKVWRFQKFSLSLHRQNNSFDYAAECGEQALIDTTPFKSHLQVAFIFHISFEITYDIED